MTAVKIPKKELQTALYHGEAEFRELVESTGEPYTMHSSDRPIDPAAPWYAPARFDAQGMSLPDLKLTKQVLHGFDFIGSDLTNLQLGGAWVHACNFTKCVGIPVIKDLMPRVAKKIGKKGELLDMTRVGYVVKVNKGRGKAREVSIERKAKAKCLSGWIIETALEDIPDFKMLWSSNVLAVASVLLSASLQQPVDRRIFLGSRAAALRCLELHAKS